MDNDTHTEGPGVPAKHTPGPWKIGASSGLLGVRIECEDDRLIVCQIPNFYKMDGEFKGNGTGLIDDPRGQADASLIAAAPDMLEALEEFPRDADYPSSEEFRGACAKWREIYAKPSMIAARGTGGTR